MSKKSRKLVPDDITDVVYNSNNPLIRFVHNNRLNQIIDNIPSNDGLRILDAGCGVGHLMEKLILSNNKNAYYGIDKLEFALERARTKCPNAELSKMNILEIHHEDNFFDVIICTEVLEHISNYKFALKELERVLKKRGFLIITFPNELLWTISRFLLRRKPVKIADHVNSLSPKEVQKAISIELVSIRNLPFGFPFKLSLSCLMVFQKKFISAADDSLTRR